MRQRPLIHPYLRDNTRPSASLHQAIELLDKIEYLADDDRPRISKDYLAAEKIIRGEQKFRQEFYCEFHTGYLQFTGRQVFDAACEQSFNKRRIQLDYGTDDG